MGNETYQYDPYGQLIRQPHSAALRMNAWRYASGYYDVSTGLYKFGIRYYDPTIGRWTQRDPVGGSLSETVKANLYVYAGDDPVNQTDLSGRGDWLDCILAGVYVVGTMLTIIGGVGLTLVAFLFTPPPANIAAAYIAGAAALAAIFFAVGATISQFKTCWS